MKASKREKAAERNDRIVAVEKGNQSYADVRHVNDLGKKFQKELEEFLIDYHKMSGKKYRVLDVRGASEAQRPIQDGIKAAR